MIPSSRDRLMEMMRQELPTLRVRLGITQAQLSERVGVSRQTLSNLETGKQQMTWTTFMALLAFFENNKASLSQLVLIGLFDDEDFVSCLTV